MELDFYKHGFGFCAESLCVALTEALRKDGMETSLHDVAESLNIALGENHAVDPDLGFINEKVMGLIFEDFIAEIGQCHGYQVCASDGTALIWFDGFENFEAICASVLRDIASYFALLI